MTDTQVLDTLDAAFGDCPRPEHFTNHTHCCECAEHDETLRGRDRETLGMAEVGNAAYDPICFVTDAGFRYYFPALARLVLHRPSVEEPWYLEQLLFHLNDRDSPQKRRQACSAAQRAAVASFLRHVLETRALLVAAHRCEDDLRDAIALWTE